MRHYSVQDPQVGQAVLQQVSVTGPQCKSLVQRLCTRLKRCPIPKLEKAPIVWPFPDSSKDMLRQHVTMR